MQLEGLLSRFPLRELLDLCVTSLVNGAIEIETPTGTARLFFVEGQCVHAESPETTGFEAIWPLFELADAPFRFAAGLQTTQRSVVEPTTDVVARAQALVARWSRIRPYISDLKLVPTLAVPPEADQIRIYEEDWPVLSCVDGARTIEQIAQRAVLDPLEVCEALLRLRARGLVSLERKPVSHQLTTRADPPTPPSTTHVAHESSPEPARLTHSESFFARLLAELPVATAPTIAEERAIPERPLDTEDILRVLRASS